jgi:hypothetical protein
MISRVETSGEAKRAQTTRKTYARVIVALFIISASVRACDSADEEKGLRKCQSAFSPAARIP